MNPEIRDFIGRSDYYQGAVRELAGMLPGEDAALDALIGETVAESNQEEFLFVVMAAFASGRPVQGRHLARGTSLMPEKHTLGAVALHMAGDIGGPLLEAATNLRMPSTEVASTALFLAANWHRGQGEGGVIANELRSAEPDGALTPALSPSEREREKTRHGPGAGLNSVVVGGELPARLIGAARTAARNKGNTVYDLALLHAVALMSSDAGLNALVCERQGLKAGTPNIKTAEKAAKALGKQMLQIWQRPPIELLPGAPSKALATGNTMRRAVERIGRNEPCPCGSGKKYKHCCIEKDQERLHHSTSIAGVTDLELRANRERYVTTQELDSLPAHEAAQFDPLKLAEGLREAYLANLCRARLYDNCVEAFEKLGYNDKLETPFNNILIRIAQARRKDLVDRMLKLPPDKSKIRVGALELFLGEEDPARMVQHFHNEALLLLSHNEIERMQGFGLAMLKSSFCPLGILIARGMIPLLPAPEAAVLLEGVLLARDNLALSPDDPISDVLDKRSVEQRDEGKDAAALREAQTRLNAKMQEVQRYRESVERLEKELARREKVAVAPATTTMPTDEAALRELREKVNALRTALKERHNERNELRRDLQKAQADLESLRTAAPAAHDDAREDREEDLLLPQESDGNQPMRVIEFPRNFPQTLSSVPRHVARGALVMLGRVAGGEPAAFVGAVRLKACPSITRQRIGIDHRLLFRLLPDRVQVVDLIPRQDLERRIKTLV